MGRLSLCSGLLFCFSISTILMFICQNHIMAVNGFSTLDQNQKEETTNQHDTTQNNYRILKSNSRSGFAFSPRLLQQISSSSRQKIPIELDLLFDGDNELMEKTKRYDDYGHLRFGKRGGNGDQFDDYGHSRFGRSISG